MAWRGMSTAALVALLTACTANTGERLETRAAGPVAPGSVPRPTPTVITADRPVPLPTPPGQARTPVAATPSISAPRALTPFGPSASIVPDKRAEPTPVLPVTTVTAPPLAMPPEALPGLPSADDIRVVQETLTEEGLYRGQLDGKWSPELRDGVLRHQRRHGLPETAALDADTLRTFDVEPTPSYGSAGTGAKPEAGGR